MKFAAKRQITRLLSGIFMLGGLSVYALSPSPASAAQTGSISPGGLDASASGTITLTMNLDATGAMALLKVDPGACFMLTGETDTKLSLNGGFGGNTATLDGNWWFTVSPTQSASTTATYTLSATADSTVGSCQLNATAYNASNVSMGSITSQTFTVSAAPTPTPSPTPSPTPPPAGTTPSDALTDFIEIFQTILIGFAALIVPFFVLTWVIRLVAKMVRGE